MRYEGHGGAGKRRWANVALGLDSLPLFEFQVKGGQVFEGLVELVNAAVGAEVRADDF